MATKFDIEDISALDVLGMMVRRASNKDIPPCLLCMSDEARAETRALGSKMVDDYKDMETALRLAREAGNPRAFFVG